MDAAELPDLTGLSERDRRIFAMGAHWAEGATLSAIGRMLDGIPVPPGLTGREAVRAVAGAVRTLAKLDTCLDRLRRDGVAP